MISPSENALFHLIIFLYYPKVNLCWVEYNKKWKGWSIQVNFGEKLKTLRTSQKLTQQQLAERIGVAKSVVSYYESGDRYPSYDVLVKIARIFHTTTDYLLDVSKECVIDVTGLSDEDISVVRIVAEALKNKYK